MDHEAKIFCHYTTEGSSTVDRASTSYFTGREAVLKQLESRLCDPSEADAALECERKIFILYGPPGVGKSQVCLKFVEDCKRKFYATFWVNCSDEVTIKADFQAIARTAGLARNGVDSDARLGKQLLHISENWLLVLDNVVDRTDVPSLLPPGTGGCVIITTSLSRFEFWATGEGMSHRLQTMDTEESIDLLLKVAGEWKTPEAMDTAKPIVKELGGLPLALVQAGAAMKTTEGVGPRIPLKAYLRELMSQKDRLLNEALPTGTAGDSKGARGDQQSVYSTFVLSRRMIENMSCSVEDLRASMDALDILDLCSQLHNEDIHKDIFRAVSGRGVVSRTHALADKFRSFAPFRALIGDHRSVDWSDDRISRAVRLLASYSLIDFYKEKESLRFSLNRLIHSWSNYHLRRNGTASDQLWAKQTAMACLVQAVRRQGRTSRHYALRRSLYPHIVLLQKSLGTVFLVTNDVEAHTAHEFAAVYTENGYYGKAEALLRRSLAWRQAHPRPDDTAIPDTANDLALVLSKLAMYAKAREMSEAALKDRMAIRGTDDPETLQSRSTLATALSGEGRFWEARNIYKEVMRTSSRLLGADHPVTLEAMKNLSATSRELGDLDEAVKVSRAVWETHEIKLGPANPETLSSLSCLALNLEYQGTNLSEAERLCQLCWERHCKVLGQHHPDTLTSLAQLARCEFKQGRVSAAEKKYSEIKDARAKILGVEHPDTIVSDIDLVELQLNASTIDLETALLTYRNAVATLSNQWDKDHLYMLILKANLAVILKNLKYTSDARNLNYEVLASYNRLGIPRHPEALKCLLNLSTLLAFERRLDEAENLGRQAVAGYEATLGLRNRDTLISMRVLGQTLAKGRKYSDAAAYTSKAVDGLREVYGGDAPDTLEAVAMLALIEKRSGNRERAGELFREAALGFIRLGRAHWCLKYYKVPADGGVEAGPDKHLS